MKTKLGFLFLLFCALLLVGCNEEEKNDNKEIESDDFLVTFDYDNGTEKEMFIYKKGEQIDKPTNSFSKEGFIFMGWYENDTLYDFSEEVNYDMTLKAKWGEKKYTVSFYLEKDLQDVNAYKIIDLAEGMYLEKPFDPSKDGYLFKGWVTIVNEEESEFDFSKVVSKSDILYAKWEEIIDYASLFEDKMKNYFSDINFQSFSLPIYEEGLTEIKWVSSNKDIIHGNKIIRPYKETIVKLTAKVKTIYETTSSIEFDVKVPGYKLEKATSIASTYVYRNYSKMSDVLFDTMDILYCAFAEFDANGTFPAKQFWTNVKNYIIPKAKERGVYVVLVIGPSSEWSSVMDPKSGNVDTVVNNVMSKVKEYGFDGVDIDWEKPKSGEETWFTNFSKKLYYSIKNYNSNHLLTCSISGGKWCVPYYDLSSSAQYFDYVNMMAYGLEKTNKHYHNALYKSSSTQLTCSIDESVVIFNQAGIPNNKILVGLAYYGIKQVLQDSKWVRSSAVFYDSIVSDYINNPNYDDYFDEVAGVPYMMNKERTEFISYENPKSIGLKCKYVIDHKIAGVMAWEAGCNTGMELIKSVQENLKKNLKK